jgi:precorrin-6Y C5,15-methyltransferase (decarboxylating)
MNPWLSIVGIGEDGLEGLSPVARTAIAQARLLVGGERHLQMAGGPPAEALVWRQPLVDTIPLIVARRGEPVCVLASGDPMWFGVGATLARHIPPEEMVVLAHPGAFSLAAARLGWALQDCLTLSAHGRALEALGLNFVPGRKLLVLTENGASPAALARLLTERGFGPSRMCVFENLGGKVEQRRDGLAQDDWPGCADLNLVALDCAASPHAGILPMSPGLPDESYTHDGQLTKREVRAATLAALAPLPGQMLWDLGAGCGSVSIEWMRAGGQAVAVEMRDDRCALIAANAALLGVPGLRIERFEMLAALKRLDGTPDAIFVGGGISGPGVLETAWERLGSGGRLVANGVTAEAEAALLAFRAMCDGAMTRLSIARLKPIGRFHAWEPMMPVTQLAARKP